MPQKEQLYIIPENLSRALSEMHYDISDILVVAFADMDTDCTFRRHIFVLTRKQLIFGKSRFATPVLERASENKYDKWDFSEFEWQVFENENISCPKIDNLVVGGVFSLKLGQVITPLAAFTNGYNMRMRKLCEVINAINKGEVPKRESLTEDKFDDFCPKCGMIYPDRYRKICPKCMDKRSIFMRMLSYFSKHKFSMISIGALCILNALLNSAWPYLNGTVLYDGVLSKSIGGAEGNPLWFLLMLTFTMIGLKILQQLFGIFQGMIVARIVPDVVCKIKNEVFNSIQSLSVSFFTGKQTGGLMTRIAEDANNISDIFIDGLPYILPNLLTIVFSCVVMFQSNWMLAIVAVIVLPPLVLISVKLEPVMWHYNSRQHQTSRNMRAQLNDNLVGARVVKAFGKQEDETARFHNVNSAVLDSNIDAAVFSTKFDSIYMVAKNLSVLFVWGLGALFVLKFFDIEMTYGMLITFVGYVSLLAGPMDFFSYIFRWWSSSMNSAQRIFEIMDAKPDVIESLNPISDPKLDGEITIENVSFAYEANCDVLKNISLHIPAGKMLGIVGKSGAGKSTLVNLISRLYDPKSGHIYLSGIDIRELSFSDVRKNIAMVSQETYIFKGTIFDNIAYANPDAGYAEVVNAAIAASAHDFICKLPDGYDTLVGTGGRALSGGERQRISIARAVLANPKILILDEATAAVDTETEKNIQAALNQLIKGRTTISIAHRLSTLRNADFLVVFENGEITESGTHMELVKKKGTYFKLLQIQSKALAMRGISD